MADVKGNKGNFSKGNSNSGERVPESKKWEKGKGKFPLMQKVKKPAA
jgi:hypothetical protein